MHEKGQKMQRINVLIQREEILVTFAFYTLAEVVFFFSLIKRVCHDCTEDVASRDINFCSLSVKLGSN